MSNKLPAFQFYPADWRKDIAVQSLSFHDRGVWHEMLCLMHESEQRGKLLLNGQPMPTEVLARILGLDKQSLEQTLEKLLSYGVASLDENNVLFNRRMVNDEAERLANNERQRKFYNKNKPNAEPNANLTENQQKSNSPSSSSSSSSTTKEKENTTEAVVKKKAATAATPKLTDDEWLDSLKTNLAYKHLSVEIEFEKAKIWCLNNNREPTRKFFVNWLNRIPTPMQTNGATNGTNQNNGRGNYPETPAQKRERESIERQQLRRFNRERREREAAEQGVVSA